MVLTAAYAFFYPALSPSPLAPPTVALDPAEHKTKLDSPLTMEVRGSLTEAEVRERLNIEPSIDISDARLQVEHIARLPWHSGLPWAKTRVTLQPALEATWRPETKYKVSLEEEQFEFETISLPRVVTVVPDQDWVPVDALPTNRGLVISFNEEIAWDDDYISVEPASAFTITPSPARAPTEVLLQPTTRWENHEDYTITVHKEIEDLDGHQAEKDYTFNFTTWLPPRIVSATPEGPGHNPQGFIIQTTFERPVDRASVEAAFRIEPPQAGAFEWQSDTELVWRPAALPYSTAFSVSLGGIAVGGDVIEPRTWTFATHDPPVFVGLHGATGFSPSILEAVPSGGLGHYSIQWSTGETDARILAAVPYGESRRYDVTVTSGDQSATIGIDMAGVPWPYYTPQPCPPGWYMADVSICTRDDSLPGPVQTHIARIDLRDPTIVVNSLPTADYVGSGGSVAVNGDFFHTNEGGIYTLGPIIGGGGYAFATQSAGAFFALDGGGSSHVGIGIDVRPVAQGATGDYAIAKVNAAPADGEIALFNGYRRTPVAPFEGCLAAVNVQGADLADEVRDIWCGTIHDIPLYPGGFTLVGRGSGADWIRANVPGLLSVSAPGYSLVVGGSHVLQPYIAAGSGYSVEGRHPRTAIGTDEAGFLYLVSVDGRSGSSIGMTISELSGYMGSLGATRAINLDGGGSSTFVLHGQLRNVPSDGRERAVASIIGVGKTPIRSCSHPLVRC